MDICTTCKGTGEIQVYGRLPECPSCKGVGWLDKQTTKSIQHDELTRIQLQIAEVNRQLTLLENKRTTLVDQESL